MVGGGFSAAMGFAAGMVLLIARVDQAFMAHEEVAAGKGLLADVADKRFLFRVGADVSLEVFLRLSTLVCGPIELAGGERAGRCNILDWGGGPGGGGVGVRTRRAKSRWQ